MYLLQAIVGIPGLIPPLCTLKELQDGTYDLKDVETFYQLMMKYAD